MLGSDEPILWKFTKEALQMTVPKTKPCDSALSTRSRSKSHSRVDRGDRKISRRQRASTSRELLATSSLPLKVRLNLFERLAFRFRQEEHRYREINHGATREEKKYR